MACERLIEVEKVGKKFCRSLKRSMIYGMSDLSREIVGLPGKTDTLREHEFWALKNISFNVDRGECLAIIGRNGAGKSTLLKLLNGILAPDMGKITLKGKLGAMIEVGAGFHPMLTGRENIFIAGTILGLSRREIKKKLDEIIAFSELEDFIDTPVKFYSSGMYVRLGFSIAIHIRPDILLLDEILAVGDIGFRAKCIDAIGSITKNSAVILVTHNMPDIARIATKAMIIDHGEVVTIDNDVSTVINKFFGIFKPQQGHVIDNKSAQIDQIEINGKSADIESHTFRQGSVEVSFNVEFEDDTEKANIFIGILKQDFQIVAQCSTLWSGVFQECKDQKYSITARLDNLFLNPGTYYLVITILDGEMKNILVQHYGTVHFKIAGPWLGYSAIQLYPQWDIVPHAQDMNY